MRLFMVLIAILPVSILVLIVLGFIARVTVILPDITDKFSTRGKVIYMIILFWYYLPKYFVIGFCLGLFYSAKFIAMIIVHIYEFTFYDIEHRIRYKTRFDHWFKPYKIWLKKVDKFKDKNYDPSDNTILIDEISINESGIKSDNRYKHHNNYHHHYNNTVLHNFKERD